MSYPFRTKPLAPQDDPSVTIIPPGPSWRQFGITALGTTLILALCWYFAGLLIQQTNQQLGPTPDPVTGKVRGDQDQKHNINQALLARDFLTPLPELGTMENIMRWMPHRTDGVVAPLWPWIAARLASPSQPYREAVVTSQDKELFSKVKWANVAIVLVFLWGLGLVMARSFRPAAAIAVLLLGAFGALIPRAVYFQPEPIFYILFFLTWVCAVKLLLKNDIWLHALFGLLGGFAYLAKTSVEPLILGWFVISGLRFLIEFKRPEDLVEERPWNQRNHFIGLLVFAFAWLAVTAPRYASAHEKWGNPRFSYPEVWMWMDDFDDGYAWMQRHPGKAALDAIPAGEKPSPAQYFKTHTPQEAKDRLISGTTEKLERWLTPKPVKPKKDGSFSGWKVLLEHRGFYLGALLIILLLAALILLSKRKSAGRSALNLPSGSWAAGLFTLCTLAGYSLLYGFYNPIGRGDRFMLSLYLPLVFCLVWAAESLMNLAIMRRAPRWTEIAYQSCLWLLSAAILWRLAVIYNNPVFDPAPL